MILPAAALAVLLGASGPATLTVDAGKAWSPDTGYGRDSAGTWRSGSRIEPVWARQNVWMPWARWKPDEPATLPLFDEHVREIALIMPAGFRPDSDYGYTPPRNVSVPDLYRDSAGIMLPFDPKHPFFNALRLFRSRGIRPVLDLGPVPRALCARPQEGPFRWNTAAPADYPRYAAYVKALFEYLSGPAGFTRKEVESWRLQLWREPDNHESWNPRRADHSIDAGNLEEFEKLYDYTLAGLRAAGIRSFLGVGNLMVAYPGVWIFKDSWLEPLCRHLADTTRNLAPGLLHLPRIASVTDTLLFSFTAYGGHHTQLESDPRVLDSLARRFRREIRRFIPSNPLEITVGEGNLFSEKLHHRSDGSELGAAWAAAIYKASLDAGVDRYQFWGFASAPHGSMFNEAHGLQSGTFNTVRMYRMLAQGKRLRARLEPADPVARPGDADALASAAPDGSVRVLAFHYRPERGSREDPGLRVRLRGLKPGRPYAFRLYRVDRERGQYLERWLGDLKAAGETLPVPYDACMEYQFTPSQWALWNRNRAVYEGLTRLDPVSGRPAQVRADSSGALAVDLPLAANSVSLAEWVPAGKPAAASRATGKRKP